MKLSFQSRFLLQRANLKCAQSTCLVLALCYFVGVLNTQIKGDEQINVTELIERLSETNLRNRDEIYAQLRLTGTKSGIKSIPAPQSARKLSTANPYEPRFLQSFDRFKDIANSLPRNNRSYEVDELKRRVTFFGQEPVFHWYSSLSTNTDVCGLRFIDSRRQDYELRTFSSAHEAIVNDFVITHRFHCGTCSSLRNLAIYLAKPDLTTASRSCARKLTLRAIKECLVETIGFEAHCAETWAYNVAHTKRQCMTTCVKHYGLWRVLRNNMGDSHVDDAGRLNPCLACDEYVSGPGFQYAAGRTRRSSGLISAIERPSRSVYAVDHSLYFK